MKRSVSVLSTVVMVAAWLMVLPSVGGAYTNFVMTGFQSLGSLDLSGQITYTFDGTPNLYGFCANNGSALLYQGTPYYGEVNSISGNLGLLEAAYLMATYDPAGAPSVPDIANNPTDSLASGVILQLAIWSVTGQLSGLTNYSSSYPSLYAAAGSVLI